MYKKAFGLIETLAPLHVGASAGEEAGNLNLIFRDQFTQTGIIPGSSIRGRFRANLRPSRQAWLQEQMTEKKIEIPKKDGEIDWRSLERAWLNFLKQTIEQDGIQVTNPKGINWKLIKNEARERKLDIPIRIDENYWYGHEAVTGQEDGGTTEANAKFEYASLVWLPVFCPGQPIVWVTCPWLLKRYQQVLRGCEQTVPEQLPAAYSASKGIQGRQVEDNKKVLFFNLGFLQVTPTEGLEEWLPAGTNADPSSLVVVGNNDISMIHDMALYRQSRVRLADDQKKVDGGGFFNVEALPEGSILVFPIALKETGWQPFGTRESEGEQKRIDVDELYFGGLESVGFGRCRVSLGGEF